MGRAGTALQLADETATISSTIEPAVVAAIARILALPNDRERLAQELADLVEARGHTDFVLHASRSFPPLASYLSNVRAVASSIDAAVSRSDSAHSGIEGLTKREREILELVRAGLRNREIADRLFISEVTVKVHVRHILEKTGTRSRTEAAVLAAQESPTLKG